MRVLYLGDQDGMSGYRLAALRRRGEEVVTIDPKVYLPTSSFVYKFHWETGYKFLQRHVETEVLRAVDKDRFDVVWVNKGVSISRRLLERLKERTGGVTVSYNNDDPYGGRDGRAWATFLESIPAYDLMVVPRLVNFWEAKSHGANYVLRCFHEIDSEIQAEPKITEEDRQEPEAKVLFIGTYFMGRDAQLKGLKERGIPLTLRGNSWDKAPEWAELKPIWKAAVHGEAYLKQVRMAKVSLCFLSRGNRDLHTTRSNEIPYAGGLLLAERTPEHQEMYVENEEAMFFDSLDECAEKCNMLLADDALREKVRLAGQRRAIKNNHTTDALFDHVFGFLRQQGLLKHQS
ncbi:MAG: CgeB family protein [Fimbriimonadaceae bacterium]